eukprot:116711_1
MRYRNQRYHMRSMSIRGMCGMWMVLQPVQGCTKWTPQPTNIPSKIHPFTHVSPPSDTQRLLLRFDACICQCFECVSVLYDVVMESVFEFRILNRFSPLFQYLILLI